MKSLALTIICSILLVACAGEDYTPVYFPELAPKEETKTPPPTEDESLSSAKCELQLTAKLCVKIKGENIEVGTKEEDPLCADTPPIPFEIEGEKIFLKGSNFPDISVSVDVKGVQTPMTINGKGDGDGRQNIGEGEWSPDGNITIHHFSFFINVLGVSAEVPELTLTTAQAKTLPDLSDITGSPVGPDGQTRIVTGTVLGSLFEAADKFLLGASLQATFDGTMDPPLSECTQAEGSKEQKVRVVKLRRDERGTFLEESIPENKILEISQGTFIAEDPQDIGPSYETEALFKATNTSSEKIEIDTPHHIGPFYFAVEGKTKKNLPPNGDFQFQVTFRPTSQNVKEPGEVRTPFTLGPSRFFLKGVALKQEGKIVANEIDESGKNIAEQIQSVSIGSQSVPASSAKNFFKCQTIACNNTPSITRCEKCTPPQTQGCELYPVNLENHPLEEVSAQCRPLNSESPARMSLNLAATKEIPLVPSKQLVTIQNKGVQEMTVTKLRIEEMPNSKSKGEFKLLLDTIQSGDALEKASASPLPITLPPFKKNYQEKSIFVHVAYLPVDLMGYDGKQASTGRFVIDQAYLVVETNGVPFKILLTGQTKVQEIPDLQVHFGTPTGVKIKGGGEIFTFEEVHAGSEDIAYPVFLKLADAATKGLRITEIKTAGEDPSYFEWLDSNAKVAARQPEAGKGKRCSVPIFDSNGRLIDERFDLHFVSLGSQGFDLKPGASASQPPLFGCMNFHRNPEDEIKQRLFRAELIITALQLDEQGRVEYNPDRSTKQTRLVVPVIAAIDPLEGKFVLRITQTFGAVLNPTAPILTAVPAKKEVDLLLKEGIDIRNELIVMQGALILDPFDKMELTDHKGEVVGLPGDGKTGLFRPLDTRPVATNYEEDYLYDYAALQHDSTRAGSPGVFYDYEFEDHPLPDPLKVNGWRIFTGSLSYPGPLSPRAPIDRTECVVVDPCDKEDLKKFSDAGVGPDGKGACAFFYASGGSYHSPAFEPFLQGETTDLCEMRDQPQELLAMDKGHYSVDGNVTFTDLGLRFWGPTYFHNEGGPLGPYPPLHEVLHIAFTTEMLKPTENEKELAVLPDEKIDFSKQEYKINLTDTTLSTPAICPANTKNRTIGGKTLSSWRYYAPLLFKDEAGEIPAGCPEPGNNFTGGTAYFKGRRLDPVTKIFTLVTSAKFGPREELSLAFKNVMIFFALNGWLCDPQGSEEDFEGSVCFSPEFNERDAKAQISILD